MIKDQFEYEGEDFLINDDDITEFSFLRGVDADLKSLLHRHMPDRVRNRLAVTESAMASDFLDKLTGKTLQNRFFLAWAESLDHVPEWLSDMGRLTQYTDDCFFSGSFGHYFKSQEAFDALLTLVPSDVLHKFWDVQNGGMRRMQHKLDVKRQGDRLIDLKRAIADRNEEDEKIQQWEKNQFVSILRNWADVEKVKNDWTHALIDQL